MHTNIQTHAHSRSKDFLDEDQEVDSSAFLKAEVGNLAYVADMAAALAEYGYSPEDRIERREICKMYGCVKADMEAEITRLTKCNEYRAAKAMRAKLVSIRQEFDALQTTKVQTTQVLQQQTFQKAVGLFQKHLTTTVTQHMSDVEQECRALEEDLALSHAIQLENLEFDISKLELPRVKHSKRVIELTRSETELVRLKLYDDAAQVRRMLGRVQPQEEAAWQQKFQKSIEDKRLALKEKQAEEWVRLSEKTKALRWKALRNKDAQLHIGEQRVTNHRLDMEHAMGHEAKLRPEMTVTPSALWLKRKNYEATAAAHRGEQFLQYVQTESSPEKAGAEDAEARGGSVASSHAGKSKKIPAAAEGKSVFAASLTARHNFTDHSNQQNTIIIQ